MSPSMEGVPEPSSRENLTGACVYSTFAAASADSVLGSSEPECEQSHSVSAIPSVSSCSERAGPAFPSMTTSTPFPISTRSTCSQLDFLASHTAPQPADETLLSICGQSSHRSSEDIGRLGSLLKTSLESDMTALTGCAVISRTKVTPSGRSIWILRYHRDSVAGIASSGWPTPTWKANHDAPSMRKWPAYDRYQRDVTRTQPRLWEWMMSFPDGWTDCVSLEMQSRRSLPSSSAEQS